MTFSEIRQNNVLLINPTNMNIEIVYVNKVCTRFRSKRKFTKAPVSLGCPACHYRHLVFFDQYLLKDSQHGIAISNRNLSCIRSTHHIKFKKKTKLYNKALLCSSSIPTYV